MEAKNTPLVSIGVPVFNGEPFIAETIEALTNQDYVNIEIIISDNASTDNTEEICLQAASQYKNIKFYHQSENIGWQKNYEFVLNKSLGTYFCWVAADDLRSEDFVSKLLSVLEAEDRVACVMSDVIDIDENGEFIQSNPMKVNRYSNFLCGKTSQSIFFLNPGFNTYHCVYGLFRKSALKGVSLNFNDFLYKSAGWEVPFLAQVSLIGAIVSIPDRLMKYRNLSEGMYLSEIQKAGLMENLWNYLGISKALLLIAFSSDMKNGRKLKILLRLMLQLAVKLSVLARVAFLFSFKRLTNF